MTGLRSIYFIAIGGTGVAPLACLLKAEGYQVAGSDGPLYPPMSTLLRDQGIEALVGFDPSHLDPPPDLVVVGNAVPRQNPEAVEMERLGLAHVSMPEALSRFFLEDRRPLVVAGTHGKTTTSALAARVWDACGRDPGYLIGGMPLDFDASFHRGTGARFVVEGDEYNAAYFDRGPKFLHYRPETLILTGVEHDHIDLYPDVGSFRQAFRDLISILPADGLIAADGDTPEVRRLLEAAPCEVVTYGFSDHVDVRPLQPPTVDADGTRFTLDDGGKRVELRLRVPGDHNVRNALGVWIAARRDGLGADEVAAALASFRGVQRRLEVIRDAPGPLVFDDFAHHPTEIAASLSALRRRYPDRRLIACFEPRSLTAGRAHLFESYLEAFAPADLVLLAPVFHADRLQDEERIDLEELASTLSRRGVDARATDGESRILEIAVAETRPDDVLVTMSSGSFGGLPRRIAAALPAHAAGQEISGPPESGL